MQKLLVILLVLHISCTKKNTTNQFQLEQGDLLFQDLDNSPLCDAIELVTPGYKNGNFSHIGIVLETNIPFTTNPEEICEEKYLYGLEQDVKVLEALPGGVKTIRLDSFLNRSTDENQNPKVIVGRLKKEYRFSIEDAIYFLKSKIGTKYDDLFLVNNNTYYCSELIYEAFKKNEIFKLRPMNFLHPISNDTLEIWKEYYSKLKAKIPQNELGINPGIMSLSEKIEIIHFYGHPDGIKK